MPDLKWLIMVLVTIFLTRNVNAQPSGMSNCEATGAKIGTLTFGEITEYHCPEGNKYFTKWILGNQVLLYGRSSIRFEISNSTKAGGYRNGTLFVFGGATEDADERGCPACLYLIDLTGDKPRVFAFGVKNALNQYHWASWGKKRSVIAIKHNVKFVYKNGKLTPPKKDNDLYLTIKPTMFETPVEKLEPFVEEVSLKGLGP